MLLRDLFASERPITLAELKADKQLVKNIQNKLSQMCYYLGSVTGEWGPQTEQAIALFCRSFWLDNAKSGMFGSYFAKKLIEAKVDVVSLQALGKVFYHASPLVVESYYKPINFTLHEWFIKTPLQRAHFLAQIGHESGHLRWVEEWASGEAYEGWAELGNTEPGDGRRFKGRGLIQVTGRANYKRCGQALGIDLIRYPALLMEPEYAARSAGWFWHSNNLNAHANRDDVARVTRIINGGYNGLQDRVDLLKQAKQVLGVR